MQYTTLDKIIKGVLLNTGYSRHWYFQCLVAARDCLLELSLDDLQIVNTVLLDIIQDGMYADLPCDYLDYTMVGVRVGQKIRPLVERENINPLHNYDSNNNIVNYTTNPPVDTMVANNTLGVAFTFPFGLFWGTTLINDYGENIGRLFGWGASGESDTFKIVRERNQIQLNENSPYVRIVLQYISNGMGCDAATQVDQYAERTIKDYILWDLKRHNRTYNTTDKEYERMIYVNSRKVLRARKDEINIYIMKRLLQRNYHAAPNI